MPTVSQTCGDLSEPNPFIQHCTKWLSEEEYDHRTIDINIRKIHQEIYNSKRFEEIAILIVDYAMPNINGLEMLEKIENHSIKKILLTGEADEKIAVDAFNKGLIHSFVRKDENDFLNKLTKIIHELQKQYFINLTDLIIGSLAKETERPSCLDNQNFIQLFEDICKKKKIIEYYLIDEFGSFLLLNDNADLIWFAVTNRQEMEHFHEMAKEYQEDAGKVPEKVFAALQEKKKMPFFYFDKNKQIMPNEWDKYLYPIKQITDTDYYYAIITDIKVSDIKRGEILTYREFLRKN